MLLTLSLSLSLAVVFGLLLYACHCGRVAESQVEVLTAETERLQRVSAARWIIIADLREDLCDADASTRHWMALCGCKVNVELSTVEGQ